MNTGQAKAFLGVGWKFPVGVDPVTGRMLTSSHEQSIAESIGIIIATRPGERMMRPDFGCALQDQLFKGTDFTALSLIAAEVERALVTWEPRITAVQVTAEAKSPDAGALRVYVSCIVRATNSPFNQVYPYYISEGVQ
jgi:phage baseplate assembly protein W